MKNKTTKKDTRIWLYGYHAVLAAISNPDRKIHKLLVTKNSYDLMITNTTVKNKIQNMSLDINFVERKKIESVVGHTSKNQGFALLADKLVQNDFAILPTNTSLPQVGIILDKITDPQNIGSILRSAYCFGINFVITSYRNMPGETPVLASSSSGAIDKIKIYKTINLVNSIKILKKSGWWVIGLDSNEGELLSDINLLNKHFDKVILVLGSEGRGLGNLLKKNCDFLAKINLINNISLNVSNAAAISFYEISKLINKKSIKKDSS